MRLQQRAAAHTRLEIAGDGLAELRAVELLPGDAVELVLGAAPHKKGRASASPTHHALCVSRQGASMRLACAAASTHD
jgi:hypothetical protein